MLKNLLNNIVLHIERVRIITGRVFRWRGHIMHMSIPV
jgi:hypothetical protein